MNPFQSPQLYHGHIDQPEAVIFARIPPSNREGNPRAGILPV